MEMEIKELFRATCYMMICEKKCDVERIQHKFRLSVLEAYEVHNMLVQNGIVSPCDKINIDEIEELETILDELNI